MTSIRLAPMAGITDWPFRVLCFEQGCDVATTEMVSAMGYLYAPRNHPATVSLIERRDSEGKLLVQIFGKEADLMARAAEELFITQPAVTKHINALEKQLGVPLFVRRRNAVALTPQGELLLGYVRRLLALYAELNDAFAGDGESFGG